jgi:hypothetical protein
MKTILLLCALTLLSSASAFARGGKLSTLTLGFPDGATPEARAKVINFLTQEFTMIEGSFINQFTTQSFSGSTTKLNELIRLLNASQFELKVAFGDMKDDRVVFALSQTAGGAGETTITVNVASKDLKWSDLQIQIPPAKLKIEPNIPETRGWSEKRKD